MSTENILTRSWFSAVSATTFFFFLYQTFIVLDQKYNSRPLCPFDDKLYPPWYWYTNYSVCGAFGITCLMLLFKLSQSERNVSKSPYLATLCVAILGLIATLLSLLWNAGGICVDVFGVASPAVIWGEWMACGPLLLFISIALVDRQFLTQNDVMVMVAFFTSIAIGFIIIIKQPIWLASIWLAISVLAYLPMFWLVVIASHSQQITADVGADEFQLFSELTAKKNNLCVTLIISLPLFIIVYFLALFGAIDAPMTITCYQILSVMTKGVFAAMSMDAHLELLNNSSRALIEEKRANEARRAFLRLIFHKVRTPLNSLTMGIEILGRNDQLVESEIESLLMMKDASSLMTDTLNDMFTMQKIEEGKLELELSPFSVYDTISKVCCTLNSSATEKGIQFRHDIAADVPHTLLGDRCRIEHVYFILLGNAIKVSPRNSNILTQVSCQESTASPETVQLTVSVSDHGPGIPMEKQKTLFTSSMSMKSSQLQQQLKEQHDHRIGLVLCQQLIALHGGTIRCLPGVGGGVGVGVGGGVGVGVGGGVGVGVGGGVGVGVGGGVGVGVGGGVGSTFAFTLPLQLLPAETLTTHRHIHNNISTFHKLNLFDTNRNLSCGHYTNERYKYSSSNGIGIDCNVSVISSSNASSIDANGFGSCSRIEEELLQELSQNNLSRASCLLPVSSGSGSDSTRTVLTNELSYFTIPQQQQQQQPQQQQQQQHTNQNKYMFEGSNNNNNNNDNNVKESQINRISFRGPVLVVDDVKCNRKMLAILLGKSGVVSGMAEDGDEAVALVQRDLAHFQMVFMDNMMPRMNGVEAAKILRNIGYQGLIIGITGNVLEEDVAQYLKGGADMVLSKPLKMSELERILKYVEENGCQTVLDRKLVECGEELSWVVK